MPDELEDSCHYICTQGEWLLSSGSAPEGYYCPSQIGGCVNAGDELSITPVPIPPDPSNAAANSSNRDLGIYIFDRNTQSLYFREGNASTGKAFVSKFSMEQLKIYFPATAAEVAIISSASSIDSFSVSLSALDSETVAKLKSLS